MTSWQQKTLPTDHPVEALLATVDPRRAADARTVMEMMQQASGAPPVLWGPSIIGFGQYAYTYASGHSGIAQRIGLSPRKANLVLYLAGLSDVLQPDLAQLGKHRTGGSCLYLGALSGIDPMRLARIIQLSWDEMARRHPV